MSDSFFFYDLETSGINPRSSRIMQFAGQRTDQELTPIGEHFNFLIKLSEDVIPDPGAILVTGIAPQKTVSDGVSEAEFFKIFNGEIAKPNTVFVGFNNIRFDDEFIRFGQYRNFYDPYEWQWKEGKSRWDILDLSRITRALRPEGIEWSFASDGKATNRLEYLSSVNKLDHSNAHDALSDVNATIAFAKLVKQKQPKLFDYMLNIRSKKAIQNFINENEIFVYVSGKYSVEHEKLAVVKTISKHPQKNDAVLVYNLLVDASKFINMTPNQLAESMVYVKDKPESDKLPIKTLQFNRCPSVAPLVTLDEDSKKRLDIDQAIIDKNLELIKSNPDFIKNITEAVKLFEKSREQKEMIIDETTVDHMLYNSFINDFDKKVSYKLLKNSPDNISSYSAKFNDERLKVLVPLYKARNYPKLLTNEEIAKWENYKLSVYTKNLPIFMKQFESILSSSKLTINDKNVLEELKMYVESLIPAELYS